MTALLAEQPKAINAMDVFLNPPDDKIYELVEGKLVQKQVGIKSAFVAFRVAYELESFARSRKLGWATTEGYILCFPWLKKHGRRPDVVFYRTDRLAAPGNEPPTVAPNIVVEVVSPTDKATDVERKLAEYQRAGVDLVWIVNYDVRNIRVHRIDGTVRVYHAHDTITAEPVLEGFTCVVNSVLPEAELEVDSSDVAPDKASPDKPVDAGA